MVTYFHVEQTLLKDGMLFLKEYILWGENKEALHVSTELRVKKLH
jgi:hypothetical protein